MRLMMVAILAWSSIGVSGAAAQDRPPPAPASAVLEEGLRLAPALAASEVASRCSAAPGHWPGLTLDQGRVVAAELLDEIGGYAREAGVTGGLGGELRIVTSDQDYDTRAGEKPIPGTLRAALSTNPQSPRWIVFALPQGTSITLKDVLRPPDNVTFDGIRLNGLVDAIAIMHNDVRRCSDGLIDITISPSKPVPARARITIGYNRFAEHDKVMLFGTFTCGPTGSDDEPCDARELEHNRVSSPGLYLTLSNNLFYRTNQRHTRVFGRVMAHILGNVIAYGSYGTFVSNGARALIERNIYLMTGAPATPKRAVWTTKTPGAMRMPWDVEGFIKSRDRGGSVCLNSLRLWISGFLPGFSCRFDALLGCDGGRA